MIGGFPGVLAGLGAVNQGANLGTLQAAQALRQLYAAQQAQQDLQQQQQWQQYAGPIWQGLQQQLQPPTGGQQATGQDVASAASGYQPGAVQSYPLPPIPQSAPPPMMTGASTTPYGVTPEQIRNNNFAMLPTAKQQVVAGEGSRPGQIGAAGEEGRMQVLPSTEARLGFAPGSALYSDAPGEAYLGKLAKQTGGDLPATVGGYNRGEGWAKQWQAAAGNPEQQAKLIQQLAPAYQRIVYADMFRKTQAVTKAAGPEVAQGTQNIAHDAAQMVDPLEYGRKQLADTVALIQRAAPGAPGAVKFMALGMISKIMQPSDQVALKLLMQQNQADLRVGLAELQASIKANAPLTPYQQATLAQGETRLEQGAQAGGSIYQPADAEGKPLGPPMWVAKGQATPITGLPAGAAGGAKVGTKGTGAGAGGVSPSEVEFLANYVKATGAFPVGMSRNKDIQNAVYGRLAEQGVDPGKIAQIGAGFKANQASLNKAQALADQAIGYEELALRNLEVATKALKNVAPTNLGPFINKWIETGETFAGDPNVPASTAAVVTFANEYAKVMSGATGGAAATEGARKEAFDRFNPYFSAGQWDAVSAIAKQDMANRKATLQENVAAITSRIGTGGAQPAAGAPSAPDYKSMPKEELERLYQQQKGDGGGKRSELRLPQKLAGDLVPLSNFYGRILHPSQLPEGTFDAWTARPMDFTPYPRDVEKMLRQTRPANLNQILG